MAEAEAGRVPLGQPAGDGIDSARRVTKPGRPRRPVFHRRVWTSAQRLSIAAAVALVVIAIDQIAKTLVLRGIAKGEVIELALGVRLVRAFNTGMSFSLGRGSGALKLTVFVLVAGLMVVARRELRRPEGDPHAPSRAGVVAFGLIIGGAVANLVDRAFRGGRGFGQGAVIDFVDLGWWPVFNTADSALVVGCLTLMLWSFRGMKAGTGSAETLVGHCRKEEHDDDV